MRHLKTGRKLGMNGPHRKATLRNMVDSLIVSGRIKTTVTRAKELRKLADKMIGYAKRDTLHTKRMALQTLRTKDAFKKLFSDYKELFATRSGGYTRIIKLGPRNGDNAPMAYIEYVMDEATDSKSTGRKRRRKKKSVDTVQATSATTETKKEQTENKQKNLEAETVEAKKEDIKVEVKLDEQKTENKKEAKSDNVKDENKSETKKDIAEKVTSEEKKEDTEKKTK